jgi:hypothetical protein
MPKPAKTRRDRPTAQAKKGRPASPKARKARRTATTPTATTAARAGTKLATLIEMLTRPGGATIEQMSAETGWQAHSVRGAISGALKKKLGLPVTSEKVDGRGRVYRIAERG